MPIHPVDNLPRPKGSARARRRHTLISFARGLATHALPWFGRVPGMNAVRTYIHRSDFLAGRNDHGFSGVYGSLAEAAQGAKGAPTGFDHGDMAALSFSFGPDGDIAPMPTSEYPVLFWLRPAIESGAGRLFDLGGYVGNLYYQYRDYLSLPAGFEWIVHDVPAVVAAGRRFASSRHAPGLSFSDDVGLPPGCDIVLAAGSLQYVEDGYLPKLLRAAGPSRPRHVIVHRTPLHPTRSFVTLQSTVSPSGSLFFCPYTVACLSEFKLQLEALGYALKDSWDKPRSLDVPLHRECHLDSYAGLYFRLDD
jgi:putative methyltransferase (TIGR04325 family)